MDINSVSKWAESQGWKIKVAASGHRRFYDEKGNYITDYPSTPSSQRRFNNLVADLKRAGLELPPPSKKIQRARKRTGK
jgi:hypothetical protein